jgi:hypothetical protein
MNEKLRKLVEKTIAVVSGYFVSLPIFYLIDNELVKSLVLMGFFIGYYWVLDVLFAYVRKRQQLWEVKI